MPRIFVSEPHSRNCYKHQPKNEVMKVITRVYKMGNKLGVYLNSKQRGELSFNKGDYVSVKVSSYEADVEFISRFNYNIVLRRQFVEFLKLKPDDEIIVNVEPLVDLERAKEIFVENKIDLLALIPEKTFGNYKIFVTLFNKDDKQWLRMWYLHGRGSGRQVELIRYIDIDAFGRLLGQLQAEGDKFSERSKHRVDFANNVLAEHADFINDMTGVGVSARNIQFLCKFNPGRFDKTKLENETRRLCEKFGISDVLIRPMQNQRIWCSFKTTIRRSILAEIMLSSMDTMRKFIVEKSFTYGAELLAKNFLAKVLTGDGTLDIRKRNYDYPTVRIKIVDQNLETLEDYKKILQKFGFKPKVINKRILVRAHCSFENLLFLFKIKAFRNSNNWNKLVVVITLMLNGRRTRTFERFIKLSTYGSFGIGETSELFGLTRSMAKDWLSNAVKNGFMKANDGNYVLTERAEKMGEVIPEVKIFLGEVPKVCGNLWDTLNYLKLKKTVRPNSASI